MPHVTVSATAIAVLSGIGLAAMAPNDAVAQDDNRPHIVVAMEDFPPLFEPLEPNSRRTSGWRIMYNIFDGLLDFDFNRDFEIIPGIATEWARVSDTEIDMTIRDGVVFHDGTTMTVEDVAFSLGDERMLNPDAPGFQQKGEYLPSLTGVEIIDDRTIRITTDGPSPVVISQLANWGSQIVSEDAYRAAASWDDWGTAPIGTGPYRLAEFRPDELVRLEAHDSYWGGRPPVASITFRLVPEEATRIAGLVAGDFDIITNVSFDQIDTIEAAEGVEIVGGNTPSLRGVYFDSETNPQLADPRVRVAMSHAIDRQLIVDTLWGGRVSIPNGPQTRAFGDMYIEEHVTPAYDPDRARTLLDETSYDGEVIPLRMVAGDTYPGEFTTAQVLVEMWRAVGINVEIELVENWPQVSQRPGTGLRNSGDEMMYPDPVAQMWRRHGTNGWTHVNGWWSNEEFNELGDVLLTSLDEDERRRAFARMLMIFDYEDPPSAVFHTGALFYGLSSALEWAPYPHPRTDFRARNLAVR